MPNPDRTFGQGLAEAAWAILARGSRRPRVGEWGYEPVRLMKIAGSEEAEAIHSGWLLHHIRSHWFKTASHGRNSSGRASPRFCSCVQRVFTPKQTFEHRPARRSNTPLLTVCSLTMPHPPLPVSSARAKLFGSARRLSSFFSAPGWRFMPPSESPNSEAEGGR